MIIPPDGSKIRIDHEDGYQKIVIPLPGGIKWYRDIALMLGWLVFWVISWIFAAVLIIRDFGNWNFEWFFLAFCLCGWTIAGKFVFSVLHKLLRPPVPEALTLSKPLLLHDSGLTPRKLRFMGSVWNLDPEKGIRMKTKFDPEQLKSIQLRDFRDRKRLTIDQGSRKFEIGFGASDPEREWLYEVLKKEYNL